MRKMIALLLALLLIMWTCPSVLAEEKDTITVFVGTETYTPSDINSMTIFKKAEEATNVHVEWVTVAQSSYNDKLGVLLSTDDLPDVILGGVSTMQLSMYGAQGSFIPMEDYLTEEYMPNLYAILQDRPELINFVTAADGHVYGVPRVTEGPWNRVSRIYSINRQWLETLGLEEPANLEEFKEMLIAFRDQDPNGNGLQDEIPLTFEGGNFDVAVFEYIFGAYGMAMAPGALDVQDGKVVCLAQDERYAEAIRYIADLYAEGLIDPDAFVMDSAQWKAKISSNPATVGVSPNWDHNDNISDPDILAQYDFMKPLFGANGEEPVLYSPAMYGYARGYGVVTKACENPEAAVRWIDYWFDAINSIEASEGPIGERQYVNEDGTIVTGLGETTVVAELPPRASVCLNPYACRALLSEYYSEGITGIPSTYPKVAFMDEYILQYADPDPFNTKLYYTVEESETISMLETDIRNLINSKAAEWIINGTIDNEWEDFQYTLTQMGIDEYLAVQQTAYDRLYNAE